MLCRIGSNNPNKRWRLHLCPALLWPTSRVPARKPELYLSQKKRMDVAINSVISKGAYILQDDLMLFEKELANYTGSKHAIGVANGTDAIWLALLAADIGSGDEVIVPSHTYIASPAAIKFVGAEPILAECAEDHLLDPEDIQKRITSRTKAIMPVQLNGRTCEMDKIQKIADENNLLIIEDAAQGLGSLYNNKMAGTFGIAGTYSFYPAKVLGCFGDGGAVVTDDDNIFQRVYEMRDHGRDNSGEHVSWGFNSRLDEIQATILRVKLKYLDSDNEKRRQLAAFYNDQLSDLPIKIPEIRTEVESVYHLYVIQVTEQQKFIEYLLDKGIQAGIHYPVPVHLQPAYKGRISTARDMRVTEGLTHRIISLPMYPELSMKDAGKIINNIKNFCE